MVSVPKFPPIPRLSIIVPIGRDLAAFERTLISVLENQPADCEILVAHDGNYDDPFQLCDELRFVIADSNATVDLVSAGVAEARGRFVHVLADGIRATAGWADAAVEKFEHFDAGAVAPIIRHAATQKIIAAGWGDAGDRLCQPAWQGRDEVGTNPPKLIGAYLQASFWRREVIRSLADAFTGRESAEAAYAYEHLMRAAGWRCVLATECNLLNDSTTLPWDSTSFGRGKRLRAVRNHFLHQGILSRTISIASSAVLASLSRPRNLVEAFGQAAAPLAARRLVNQLRPEAVTRCNDQQMIVTLPQRSNTNSRQAA